MWVISPGCYFPSDAPRVLNVLKRKEEAWVRFVLCCGKRMRKSVHKGQDGFTLLELMTVVAVVGVLAAQATISASVEQKRAKRTEVTLGLDAIDDAQRVFRLEHGRYASNFEELTFTVDGAVLLSPNALKARRYTYVLAQPWGAKSFYVTATGQIDSDEFPDVWVLEAGRQ